MAGERRPKTDRLAQLTGLHAASQLLDIKVCDPAMGSGHFLVSLADFLADRVLEILLGLRLSDLGTWIQQRGALTIHHGVVHAQHTAAGMAQVETMTDSDITEVEESTQTFEGVSKMLSSIAKNLA